MVDGIKLFAKTKEWAGCGGQGKEPVSFILFSISTVCKHLHISSEYKTSNQ